MKQTFEVKNVKCGGCVGTLKKSLLEIFGEVEVNLEVEPRKITLDIEEEQVEELKLKLRSLVTLWLPMNLLLFKQWEQRLRVLSLVLLGRWIHS